MIPNTDKEREQLVKKAKFEEQFPSFNEYSSTEEWDELINWNEDSRGYDKELIKKAIKEHCLDKRKVREVLDNHKVCSCVSSKDNCIEKIKEELGL